MKSWLVAFLAVGVLLVAQEHPTGVLMPSAERQQWIDENVEEWQPSCELRGPLPARVVNTAHLPQVWSQGDLGICGSFAPTYYVRNYYESKARGEGRWNPNNAEDRKKLVSPMWTVLVSDHLGNISTGPGGAYVDEAIEKLCAHGYLTLEELPFEGSYPGGGYHFPSAEMQLKALRRKSGVPVYLSDITTEEGLLKLKQALAGGDIFAAITAPLPENFDYYGWPTFEETLYVDDQPVTSNNHGVFVWPNGRRRDAHAITIIGYDDTKEYTNKEGETRHGALRIVNSWGDSWGDGGYLWIAYDAFLKYGFLSSSCTVYSFRNVTGEKNYTPAQTAVVTYSNENNDFETGWLQSMGMGGVTRFWPQGISYDANGLSLPNIAPANSYLVGSEDDETKVEILLDLNGFEDTPFLQYNLYLGFLGNAADRILGKLVSIETRDAEFQPLWRDEADDTVQRLSTSYPGYEYWSATLREEKGFLPELHPHTGGFAMADLNGDGLKDAVAFIRQYNAQVTSPFPYVERRSGVFLRNANGTWTEKALPIPENDNGICPGEVVPVDLDQDGIVDLAICDGWKAYFLKNDGKGNFSSLATVDFGDDGSWPGIFAMADFDNDGKPDFTMINCMTHVVIRQESPTKYTVYPVSKNITQSMAQWTDYGLAVGDVNGDGWTDIVTAGTEHTVLHINNGDLTFTDHTLQIPGYYCVALAVADADQDGCDDILYSGSPLWHPEKNLVTILKGRPNDANGHFQQPVKLPLSATFPKLWGGRVAWADLDGDGRLEAVVSGNLGKTSSGAGSSSVYGEGQVDQYYLHEYGQTYFKVLKWNGERYADAGLQLPGTVGFDGGSIMDIVDVDGDGRLDVVHGGCLCGHWEVFSHGGPNHDVTGMKYLHNDIPFANQNPTAPTNLKAAVKGNGKATLTWNAATDAETLAGGLRYLVRVGTATGKDDIIKGDAPFAYKSGVTLTHLPAKKLYAAVRTVDATGNLSPWSAEISFTPTGTTPTPKPVAKESLPEIVGNACPENVEAVSEDETKGWASAYTADRDEMLFWLSAGGYPGYRFAYWEGPVDEPLNRTSNANFYEDLTVVAHFLPDDTRLQTSATATGYLDPDGNLWMYGSYQDATGPVNQDTPPRFSAQSNVKYFTLANGTAYFNRNGPTWYWWDDYDWYRIRYHHYPPYGYNQLLCALDGSSWYKLPSGDSIAYLSDNTEHTEHAWGGPGGLAVLTQSVQTYNQTVSRSFYVRRGNEQDYDSRILPVPDLEDVIDCKVQEDYIIYLTSQGTVRGIGSNADGQLGREAPVTMSAYATIPGLSNIVAITAGKYFAAALDKNGQVWTWGGNSYGQLGRQPVGVSLPTPTKIANLENIVAIAAGDNHLLALEANGKLHAWGDNAQGQLGATNGLPLSGKSVKAIAAYGNHSCALTADNKLYQWGDGTMAPKLLDDLSFQAVSFSLDVDEACTTLMPLAQGSYVCRTGQELTLEAASDGEHFFQYWLVNGEIVNANPLKYTPTGDFTLKAVYAQKPPRLFFGEPEVDGGTITVPVRMGDTTSIYDGLDFTLQASEELVFSDIQFDYPYPQKTPHQTAAGTSNDSIAYRFIAFGGDDLFDCEDQESIEICRVVFRRPAEALQAHFDLVASPRLSRSRGAYSDAGAYGEPQTLLLALEEWQNDQAYDGRTMDTSSLQPGAWNAFVLPGYADATTPAQLAELLGVTDLTAWVWDGDMFKQTDTLVPNQPLLLRFTGTPANSIEYVPETPPALELVPGWNLVAVPEETPVPAEASALFWMDQKTHSNVRHEGPLVPGEFYWLFKAQQ